MSKGSFSSLKRTDWPKRDRELWLTARAPGDFFEDAGLAAGWRPATVANVEYHYGTFLWWLQSAGRLDAGAQPLDRASAVNIQDFIDAYTVDHAASSAAAIIHVIADMVRVTSPEAEVPWIMRLAQRMKGKAKPLKPTSQRRIPIIYLIRAGDELIERGRSTLRDNPAAGALLFRDGLLISMQIALPLRRKNLASLRLGVSLTRDETHYGVRFHGDDMKNGQDFHGSYPESLTEAIDFYVETARPILRAGVLGPDDGSFWLGRRGAPMKGFSISVRISELTEGHVGISFGAHSFRHSAATDIALLDPRHVGIIKSVLGHASPLSAEHYNLASGFEAASRYQELLADLRRRDREAPTE